MESFLDSRLLGEVSAMYSALARLQEKMPTALVMRQGESTSIYDCHPWLFLEAYPAARDDDVRTLNLAVRLFASSLIATNPLSGLAPGSARRSLAQMRLRTWQYQACLSLHQILPPGTTFWTKLSDLLIAQAQAAANEQLFIAGELPWSTYRNVAYDIAVKENGIGQISIFGLAELSQTQAHTEVLLRSLDDVTFAVRMLADLKCWPKQLQNGIPSLLLSEILDQPPPLQDAVAMSQLTEQIEARLRCGLSVRHVLLEALRALDQAEEGLLRLPSLGWHRVIAMYRRSCLAELESHPETVCAARTDAPAMVLHETVASRSIPAFGLKGLQMLLREWSAGLTEAAHVMPFPRSQGFNSAHEEQLGDVFQRALLLDVFCEANEKLENQLSAIIAAEVQALLDRRRTTGVGGWSYFPCLRELPADADDLAQVMLAFLRSGRRDVVSEYCERPLSVLFAHNTNSDGSFETWIIPQHRDEELALQARWVESAWGSGPDCEVMANLLYALWLYDSDRFSETIDKGTRYVLGCQQPDGSWQGTWYHGPFYGTWICLRLLERTSPASDSIIKGHEFLASRQHADGGWGCTDDSDPLSTSFALLALATNKHSRTDGQEKIDAALQWLRQTQDHDGGWQAVPFIKMELGRSTGRPWQTLTYQSRTVSTLMAVKAALAWLDLTRMDLDNQH